MNLIRLHLLGEDWFHSKKGLQSRNCLRLTRNIDEAQTYNTPNSAVRGIGVLRSDLRRTASRRQTSLRSYPEPMRQLITMTQNGEPIPVEVIEARFVQGVVNSHHTL